MAMDASCEEAVVSSLLPPRTYPAFAQHLVRRIGYNTIRHRWQRLARVRVVSERGGQERDGRHTLADMHWACGGRYGSAGCWRGIRTRWTVYEPYARQFSSFVVCLCLETYLTVDNNTRGKIFEGEEEKRTCTMHREIRLHGGNLGLNGGSARTEAVSTRLGRTFATGGSCSLDRMNRRSLPRYDIISDEWAKVGTYDRAASSMLRASAGEMDYAIESDDDGEEG
ncbi:hypothetical protein BDZ97DRAFT_587683 [Flammula alnicola]|nr:hypothetical protein BDZ97DRAFT_587683 [Flammula alnicola]